MDDLDHGSRAQMTAVPVHGLLYGRAPTYVSELLKNSTTTIAPGRLEYKVLTSHNTDCYPFWRI